MTMTPGLFEINHKPLVYKLKDYDLKEYEEGAERTMKYFHSRGKLFHTQRDAAVDDRR